MDLDVDHYRVLGLPSGVERNNLTDKDISKAYRLKVLELHPDRRRDDPNAFENFYKLQRSYNALKDENNRKLLAFLSFKEEGSTIIRMRQRKNRTESSDITPTGVAHNL